jgi:AcrR family transcriptional regulator
MLKIRHQATNDPAARATRPKTRHKRNLPAEERRRELLDAALDLFSEKGMAITIQALADRVNVTQPLVHRYFRTRADLIAGIREKIRFAHWDPVWQELLTDRSRPLHDRIPDFYDRYLPQIYSARWYRGFWYAALADPSFAQDFLARVYDELLLSIIGEARFSFGFPDLECTPATPREIELVWGMHSTHVFIGIRRYVYRTPVSADHRTTVLDQMRAYLRVVPEVMAELMPLAKPRALTEVR